MRLRNLAIAAVCLRLLLAASPALADSNCSGRNSDVTLLTLTAQAAATVVSPDQTSCTTRGGSFVLDLTTMTTASVVLTIQGKDAASGKYYTLLAGAAKTSTGTTQMWVYPGVAASANVAIADPLPHIWRVQLVVSDNAGTAAVTGTVGAALSN